ncbi:ribonuclease J [Falsihalocynthiibacter arcticus]|uniref:MBL fold metallo-hydrolase n=1 Tax=Falsihalocynthiibacter arcticus TaxID=1579316 RepID=A0A126V668_9RHOB|nr:ribonuclease J [Falsihalocynthiibacter arcticus]AML53199.1 MBL fold metallo-hydrolase [Falsihalocynthiibacter arcticus]
MSRDRLIYLPLGGAGEIGMNAYVYGYGPKGRERLILVDLGVTFPDMDSTPGVDLIMPDITWLEKNKDRLEAVFITHAHEDHIGGIAHMWRKLGAPVVYARVFTAHHARRKMEEQGADPSAVNTVPVYPAVTEAGPFKVSFFPVAHSIPESSGLVIDTPAGRIVHTGDFKLDETPVLGEAFDPKLWAEIAKPGVKALVCDSTNVFSVKAGRSEATVGPEIERLIGESAGMVVATTFASNVARLKTLALAGQRSGRSVVLLGRAMRRMVQAGMETGLLKDFPTVIPVEEAREIPRNNLLLLATGSQGERRAAVAQLSRGKYLGMSMKEGDTLLFSSKTIPGNERGVISIMNAFSEMGVDIVDDDDGLYHVSGHANRPDIERTHEVFKPQMLIPMHGEHRHLRQHAKLGEARGIASLVAVNGMMVDFAGNRPSVVEYIDTGRTYLDGSVKIGAMDGVVRERIRMALHGHVMVNVIIDEDDTPLGEPWVETMGLPRNGTSNAELVEVLEGDLTQVMMRMDDKTLLDDDKIEEQIRRATRMTTQNEVGKKAEVTVVVSRLMGA